jgi:uncharacterized protein (TIGR00369 family)
VTDLVERLGIVITEATAERVVGTMPVEGNRQTYGVLHGGASAALAETLASVGAAIHSAPERLPVGVDLNITHHRAARDGLVTGVATPLHNGRSMATWAVSVTDEEGRLLATARLTCALLETGGITP